MSDHPGRAQRYLFLNENIGGHATMHMAIRSALAERDDVEVDVVDVPPRNLVRRIAGARIPGLARFDLDLQPLREQLATSAAVRRRLPAWTSGGYDALHVYTHNIALLSPSWLRRYPTVVSMDGTTEQNGYALPQRPSTRFTPITVHVGRCFEERVYAAADAVVGQSEWCARSLREDYGIAADRVHVIPYGVRVPPRPRRTEPVTPRIVFVGTSMEGKGGWRLLDLWRHQLRERCELHLVTREDVPTEPGVVVYRDITAGDPRLDSILASATALVFPSRIDKFGYAALEALARCVPVVALRVNAMPELVQDGSTGILVDPDDDRALVAAIAGLLDDPARAAALGAAGRVDVLRRFDARVTTARLLDLLAHVRVSRRTSASVRD